MKDSFFNQRLPLGTKFEQLIIKFLETFQDIEVINTGSLKENLDKNRNNSIWKKDDYKKYRPLLMLRWMPDLLIINHSKNISIFADMKFMYTPIYLDTLPNEISMNTGITIKKCDIGNIEREAYDSYMSWVDGGVKVAIISLATFNPSFIMCDYINNVEVLFRDSRERNNFSSGSKTPRININLSKMENFFSFFEINVLKLKIESKKKSQFLNYLENNFNFIGLPRNIPLKTAESVRKELSSISNRNLNFYKI